MDKLITKPAWQFGPHVVATLVLFTPCPNVINFSASMIRQRLAKIARKVKDGLHEALGSSLKDSKRSFKDDLVSERICTCLPKDVPSQCL